MPASSNVAKILIYGDDNTDYEDKDPEQPIYVYEHVDNLTAHNVGGFYNQDDALKCDKNFFSVSKYPDSYFTMFDIMEVDFVPNEVPSIGEEINDMCNYLYQYVDTYEATYQNAIDDINKKTDIVNSVITYAMDMANSSTTPKKRTSDDAVYSVATKAKMIISNATTTFNDDTSYSRAQVNFIIAFRLHPPLGPNHPFRPVPNGPIRLPFRYATRPRIRRPYLDDSEVQDPFEATYGDLLPGTMRNLGLQTFKVIDPELLVIYAKSLRFLENRIAKGRVPSVGKTGDVGAEQRGKTNGTQINEEGWINYAYYIGDGNIRLGFGHPVTRNERNIQLSPDNPYVKSGKVANPVTGFWPKSTPHFDTIAIEKDESGISDDAVEAIFIEDLAFAIKEMQLLHGSQRWNYIHDNDQCLLIVLIDLIIYKSFISRDNNGNPRLRERLPLMEYINKYINEPIASYKWMKLLYGNGSLTGIGSGLGLQGHKRHFDEYGSTLDFDLTFHRFDAVKGVYALDLWSRPNIGYNRSQSDYINEKKQEIKESASRNESENGSGRNDAIYQLFIDKNPNSVYPVKSRRGLKTTYVNYWTLCNPNNVDLTKYMKYNK
jgi:hypothetical protein